MTHGDTELLASASLEVVAVCAYFNPAHFRSRRRNYLRFREAVERSGVPLLTVELAFGDEPFELSGLSNMLQLRTPDVMWQKERLLSIGIDYLAACGCEKVIWLDADVVFDNVDWPERTALVLDHYPVCQVFSNMVREGPSGHPVAIHPGLVRHHAEGGALRLAAGAPGLGWAARMSVLREVPLYDARILGSGDVAILMACFGESHTTWLDELRRWPFFALAHPRAQAHYLDWARRFADVVRGQVGYVDQNITTMYHGGLVHRQYVQRNRLLDDFDPYMDIALDSSNCWRWATPKWSFHQKVREYFQARREDS